MHDTFRQWNYGCMFPGSLCHTRTETNGNIFVSSFFYFLYFLLIFSLPSGEWCTLLLFIFILSWSFSLRNVQCFKCRLMNRSYGLHNKFCVIWMQPFFCDLMVTSFQEANVKSLVILQTIFEHAKIIPD